MADNEPRTILETHPVTETIKRLEGFNEALQKQMVLANAGGIAACLTFAGALLNAKTSGWPVLLPLAMFLAGLISASVHLVGSYLGLTTDILRQADDYFRKLSEKRHGDTRAWPPSEPSENLQKLLSNQARGLRFYSLIISTLFFWAGCLMGFLMLATAIV
jgi:hypothetical protein